jgi:hypothetical protein
VRFASRTGSGSIGTSAPLGVKGFVHPQSWYVDFSPVSVE